MANAKAVVTFWDEFVKRHKATAPAKYRDDLINAGMTYNKGGYHSTRAWLQKNRPSDYSIQRPADRTGPSDVGAALDITFKSAQRGDYTMITTYMKRLRAAIKDRRVYASDGVTNTFREVIGTLDGKSPANVSFYKEQVLSNSDRSHMWHMHFSFSRKWLNDPKVYLPLLDILFPTYSGGAGGGSSSGSGSGKKPAPAPSVPRYRVKINGLEYGYGAKGDHVTKVGKALVAKGFGKHYKVGPGPTWTDADTLNYADWQKHLGYKGEDADGVPGETSLKKLLGSLPSARPKVSLSKIIEAAKKDPGRPQGGTTPGAASHVKVVEAALRKEGLLSSKYASDGSFGSLTVKAYAAWQRKCGYKGKDADGIPGKESLTRLGKKHGFDVAN